MPSAVYSHRFAYGRAVSTTVPYVVPAGQVAIVTNFDALWFDPTAGEVYLMIGGGAAIGHWFDAVGHDAYWSWSGRVVFAGGETIQAGAGKPANLHLSGYLLSAV